MAHREADPPEFSGSELAAGIGVMFAATMMIVGGIFQIFQGLAAVMTDEFFVTLPDYVVTLDVSTWGWVHLGLGALTAIGGFFLFSGSRGAYASRARADRTARRPRPAWFRSRGA